MSWRKGDSFAEAFENLRAGYAAARSNRYRRHRHGIPYSGSGADYHYRSEADFLRVLEYARELDRNDCLVGQGIDRLVANLVQDGFSLDAQTGDVGLDEEIRNRWREWSTSPDECHLAGELSFADIERLVVRASIVDGDAAALTTDAGSIQTVEAHRIRTPSTTKRNVVHGVLLDERRRHVEYWVTREDVDPYQTTIRVKDIEPYPTRDADGFRQVLHVYDPKRVSQTRGVTKLAPVVDTIGMHDDIQFATLVQRQLVSFIAFIRERPDAFAGGIPAATGDSYTETRSDGTTSRIEGMAPGLEIRGEPGEKLSAFSANVPNAEFFPHTMLVLTFVAVNLDLPLPVLLLDPSKTNFSGWRGAIDQARTRWRQHQTRIVGQFHRHVYRWKIRNWLAEDAAMRAVAGRSGIDVFRHRWNCPRWPYIQPEIEAKADAERLRNTLTTPRRLLAERGLDWDDVVRETIADRRAAIAAAIQEVAVLRDELGDDAGDVTWRDLMPFEAIAGGTKAPTPTPPAGPPAPPPADDSEEDGTDE